MSINSTATDVKSQSRTVTSTIAFLLGLLATYLALPSDDAVKIFSSASVGVGLSLGVATSIDGMSGVRSLIRTDILMLWVLYGLTFLEFLFPQQGIDSLVLPDAAMTGTTAALVGFAGLAIGRNLVPWKGRQATPAIALQSRDIFRLFWVAALLGYMHILVAVHFDITEMLRQMSLPRFAQSWSRGRYGGDIFSLLVEVGALIYLIPPIAGLVYARPREFGAAQKAVVTAVFALTMYYGISSGTRNIFAVYVFTFFGAYYLVKRDIKWSRVALQGIGVVVILLVITSYMLSYRNVGLENFDLSARAPETLYIDHNMVIISTLTTVFPDSYNYLGFEILYQALVHPIPRALWPSKPEGLSVTIESIMGTTQATVASTFIGEGYMSGGMVGVFVGGLGLGVAAEMWNRVGRNFNSKFSQLLYASGFFCAAITMRSILWAFVTMLPTIALWVYGKLFLGSPASRS